MVKKNKGGSVEFAPIVASGLLLTAERLYRDMLKREKKLKGGNGDVAVPDDLKLEDVFSDSPAPVAGGKAKRPRKKRGGNDIPEVVDVAALPADPVAEMNGGRKKRTPASRKKKGGNVDLSNSLSNLTNVNVSLDTVQDLMKMNPLVGGKKSTKKSKSKKGGMSPLDTSGTVDNGVLNAVNDILSGGKSKRKSASKKKRGGDAEAEVEVKQDATLPVVVAPPAEAAAAAAPSPQAPASVSELPAEEAAPQAGGKGKRAANKNKLGKKITDQINHLAKLVKNIKG